jgi:hypothetical protein
MAVKAGEERLNRLQYLQQQAESASIIMDQAERNIERWLSSWGM